MNVAKGLLGCFFPALHCRICGGASSRSWPGLCLSCREALGAEREKVAFCSRCALFYAAACRHCPHCLGRGRRSYFRDARAAFPFTAPARRLVHDLKYRNGRFLAETMAALMVEDFGGAALLKGYDAFVPVPLADKRRRERGYNQAQLLAAALSRQTGLPVDDKLLRRVRDTGSQTALKGRERRENLQGAFRAAPAAARRNLVLVDDVITTGATMAECAKTLRQAGAGQIFLLAFSASIR